MFYLTGITRIRNKKRVYLVRANPAKSGQNETFSLSLGEQSGDLMLTEVDEKGRRVKLMIGKQEIWLSMKENGVPAPVGAKAQATVRSSVSVQATSQQRETALVRPHRVGFVPQRRIPYLSRRD